MTNFNMEELLAELKTIETQHIAEPQAENKQMDELAVLFSKASASKCAKGERLNALKTSFKDISTNMKLHSKNKRTTRSAIAKSIKDAKTLINQACPMTHRGGNLGSDLTNAFKSLTGEVSSSVKSITGGAHRGGNLGSDLTNAFKSLTGEVSSSVKSITGGAKKKKKSVPPPSSLKEKNKKSEEPKEKKKKSEKPKKKETKEDKPEKKKKKKSEKPKVKKAHGSKPKSKNTQENSNSGSVFSRFFS